MRNVSKTSLLLKSKLSRSDVRKASYVGLVLCFFVLTFAVILTSPRVPSPYRFFSVQSGSMYPALQEGDFLVTKSEPQYRQGEIITFLPLEAPENARSTTHRVVELYQLSETLYQTQGDANLLADEQLIPHSKVFGKVVWKIPLLGLVIDWIKTPVGLVLAIFLPCIAIVLTEVRRIIRELQGN